MLRDDVCDVDYAGAARVYHRTCQLANPEAAQTNVRCDNGALGERSCETSEPGGRDLNRGVGTHTDIALLSRLGRVTRNVRIEQDQRNRAGNDPEPLPLRVDPIGSGSSATA